MKSVRFDRSTRGARGRALAYALCACALACSDSAESPSARSAGAESRPLSIYTVNYPLAYFSERVGGARARVTLPAPPGVDPAFWRPDGDTVAAYQSADLVIENGAGYARWLAHASLPAARRVDTSAAFRDRLLEADAAITHGHGPSGAHSHAATAFTTWLDPTLAALHARAIAAAFAAARPADAEAFAAGLASLEADLAELDRRLRAASAPLAGEALLFSHPVYAYLGERYGLSGRALDWEPGEPPSSAQWRALDALLAAKPARAMLAEGELHPDAVAGLAERGVGVVVVAPCANRPERGDWLEVMRGNAARLEALARDRAARTPG